MSAEALALTPVRRSTSPAASVFRSPFVAATVGIFLPLICLAFDPIVFRTSFGGEPFLASYKIVGYGFISLSTFALAVWLPHRRFPSLFCGFLAAGCLFAIILGIVLFPISVFGLSTMIGILGFSPFLTAATFGYCAKHARELAGNQFKPTLAVCAFALLTGLPLTTQAYASRMMDQSLVVVVFFSLVGSGIWLAFESIQTMSAVVGNSNAVCWVADMVIIHLEDNDGTWPRNWDALREPYDKCVEQFGQPWDFEELRVGVEMNWDADPSVLANASPVEGEPPFRAIWLRDGTGVLREREEPNQMILDYLLAKK